MSSQAISRSGKKTSLPESAQALAPSQVCVGCSCLVQGDCIWCAVPWRLSDSHMGLPATDPLSGPCTEKF